MAENRENLAQKLDKDLDDFIASLENTRKSETKDFNFEQWEKEIDAHPAFSSRQQINVDGEMSEAMEALAAMQYEDDDPNELALKHKTDGNKQFEKKLYRYAVHCYTEGLKVHCPDVGLNGILFANRAAAHVRLGNIRSAIRDCTFSLKCKPENNEKVLVRGAECLLKLGYPAETLKWLAELPEECAAKNRSLVLEAENLKKIKERNRRKAGILERKDLEEKRKLLAALKERSVKFKTDFLPFDDPENLDWTSIEISFPGLENCRVKFADDGKRLLWPVLFCYPEFEQTDFVKAFPEDSTLEAQLTEILRERPDWDAKKEYDVENVKIFANAKMDSLFQLDISDSLRACLESDNIVLDKPMPCFLVLAKNAFCEHYCKKFNCLIK